MYLTLLIPFLLHRAWLVLAVPPGRRDCFRRTTETVATSSYPSTPTLGLSLDDSDSLTITSTGGDNPGVINADYQPVYPTVKSSTLFGPVLDPSLTRDSCGSVKLHNRALWVCRDTQTLGPNGQTTIPFYSSSASYTNFSSDGSIPWQTLNPLNEFNYTSELIMYGENTGNFYPLQTDECNGNPAGLCSDNTRYAIWPDSPPMIANTNSNGLITAYTWIKKGHIELDFTSLVADPAATLYRVTYAPAIEGATGETRETLPLVEVVQEEFWAQDQFAYGVYGNIVTNDTAFLYAQSSSGTIALAKVPVNSVEDKSTYQYWANNAWTDSAPTLNQTGVHIDSTGGGQGTFYFSEIWNSYVWLGQPGDSVAAEFQVTTAPSPDGPWIQPQLILSVEPGNSSIPTYSMQAHPSLVSDPTVNDIYVSYTKSDVGMYTTPVYRIEWE